MSDFIIALGVFVASIFIACFIMAFIFSVAFLIDYRTDTKSLSGLPSVRLTFSSFLNLYQANPSLWNFSFFTAKYKDFFVDFSLINHIRYRLWLFRKEKREAKKQRLKNTENFVNAFRQDLERQQEVEAKRLEEEIKKRLSQSPSLNLTETPEPIKDTREKFIVKYTGKLPE